VSPRRRALHVLMLVTAGLLAAAAAAGVAADSRTDFMLNCMGCHLADGSGTPPGIPALRDRVGYYLQIPGGREYLTAVPGAANAPMSDARLAAVLNWIVAEFGGASTPAEWAPFSAAEVSRTRGQGPADIDARRHELWRTIEARFPAAAAAY
jgi:mono/diheme cytochrome c family protein